MFQAPTSAGIPPLSVLLDSIPARPHQLARHLGVSVATLNRWRRADQAPRAAMLALFWESPWGRSFAHAAVFNEARQQAALARSLADALHQARGQLGRMLLDYHAPRAANWPLFSVISDRWPTSITVMVMMWSSISTITRQSRTR